MDIVAKEAQQRKQYKIAVLPYNEEKKKGKT